MGMRVSAMLALAGAMLLTVPGYGQLGGLVNKAKSATKKAESTAKKTERAAEKGSAAAATMPSGGGGTYYVSQSTGKARGADGKSAESAYKNLQAAFDNAEDGSTILVAEGNYLGNSEGGFLYFRNESDPKAPAKFFKVYGGYSPDFKTRDINKYITKIQPGEGQAKTLKRALLNIDCKRPYGYKGPAGEIVVDGFTFDMGEYNAYCSPNTKDERTGTPNDGVLTGRMLLTGENPPVSKVGYGTYTAYAIRLNTEGSVKIQNCTFVNCRNFAIQGSMGKGHLEIANNVFVAVRMSACFVAGSTNDPANTTLDFHHNTVAFTWARDKTNEDMGQGFRFTNRIRTINVHHNIFACNQHCAVERTFYEQKPADEAAKVSNLHDNLFFANNKDLELANGASAAIFVPVSKIEEVDEKVIGPKYENNVEMTGNDSFVKALDQSYLKGFLGATIKTSQTYDANSSANKVNRAFGLNQQGSETIRVSMYANKYPWQKAKDLFGKVKDYGAQIPK